LPRKLDTGSPVSEKITLLGFSVNRDRMSSRGL
jgi:hypothetical protein